MIEICTIGGFGEVGRNCTAVNVDGEVVLFDMGLHLERYIQYTDDEDVHDISSSELTKVGAVPDISLMGDWKDKVKAIVPTHAHLDHIGAIPFLASKFPKAKIIGTRFTIAVIKTIIKDEEIKIKNEFQVLSTNSHYKISKDLNLEFVNMTHSTPQTVLAALHTKYGTFVYANDFKLDNSPTFGKKPDYARIEKIGRDGCVGIVLDSLYAGYPRKTPSEAVAAHQLEDVMLNTPSKGKAIIVTTFSSHIARILNIMRLAERLNRKVVFLGRSMAKYIAAAEDAGIANISKHAEIVKYGAKVRKRLRRLEREKQNYVIVCTGHQGEPKAVLAKITKGEYDFKFSDGDIVIFSCTIIPTETNQLNRKVLEEELRGHNLRIFTGIHESGHGSKEDQRELINMLKPKLIIPAHAEKEGIEALAKLAEELGYKRGKDVLLLKNGDKIKVS